jgi:hypothetical protein
MHKAHDGGCVSGNGHPGGIESDETATRYSRLASNPSVITMFIVTVAVAVPVPIST